MFREMNCSSFVAGTWQDENLLDWTYSMTFRFDEGFMRSRTPLIEKALGFFAKYSYGFTRGRVVSGSWSPGTYSISYRESIFEGEERLLLLGKVEIANWESMDVEFEVDITRGCFPEFLKQSVINEDSIHHKASLLYVMYSLCNICISHI